MSLAGSYLHVRDFGGRFDDRPQNVDVEIRVDALQHAGRALQAHAGVDVLARQRPEIIGRLADAIELREHQVPDFDCAAGGRMEKDFAARAAHAVGPLAGALAGQKLSSSPIRSILSGGSLISLAQMSAASSSSMIDRHGQPVGRQAEPFLAGEKFPGPMDRFALEIIAEAEIAQHLEERVVIGGAADVIDIAGAQALLAGRGPGELELALAQEVVLELVHAGGREQHRRVPAGHQHVAGAADAALGLEKGQIFSRSSSVFIIALAASQRGKQVDGHAEPEGPGSR